MSTEAQPQTSPPETKGGVIADLQVDGAMEAAASCARAFGADRMGGIPEDEHGRTMHVHLHPNGSSLMLSDPFPEHGHPLVAPQGFGLLPPVGDIESAWSRAVEAGAEVVMPYREMFWGDVYG